MVELGSRTISEDGTIEFIPNGETVQVDINDIYADEGFIFRNKLTGAAVSNHITLGSDDSIDNYEEITE